MDKKEQLVQEDQYDFPYHYIPDWSGDEFSQVRYWSWGFRYIGGLMVALDCLSNHEFRSLVDVGCGDGRFLRDVARTWPSRRTLGIDYSKRAIGLAKALNPSGNYRCLNIIDDTQDEVFDVATAIEVLEHIPPEDLDLFVAGISELLGPGGTLIVTVPHSNLAVSKKHFQHFDSEKLQKTLEPCFDIERFIPFDRLTRPVALTYWSLSRIANHVVVTNSSISSALFKMYRQYLLYRCDESTCARIAVVCTKK